MSFVKNIFKTNVEEKDNIQTNNKATVGGNIIKINIIDEVNQTMDFSSYEKINQIEPIELSESDKKNGISKEQYDKYVSYEMNKLDNDIVSIDKVLNELNKKLDDLSNKQVDLTEIENNKREYEQSFNQGVMTAIETFRNAEGKAKEKVMNEYNWTLNDINKSDDELLKLAKKNKKYIENIKMYNNTLDNKVKELNSGLTYDKYKKEVSDTKYYIELLSAEKRNIKNEKDMLPYEAITLLKDFKNQESTLNKKIEHASGDLHTLNEMENDKYLKIYNYLMKNDSLKTNDFLASMKDTFNQYIGNKLAQERIVKLKILSDGEIQKNLVNYIQSLGYGLGDGLYDFREGFEKIYKDGEMTAQDYEAMIYLQYLNEHGMGHAGVYTTFQSVGNMTAVTASGLLLGVTAPEIAPFVTASMIGTSSYGTTKNQMLYDGYEKDKALLYAALASGSDAILEVALGGIESIGVNSALKGAEKATFKEAGKLYLKAMMQEGTEEVIQNTFTSTIIDPLVLGKRVDLGQLTEENAKTFIQSAVVAGILNGGTSAINYTVNNVSYQMNTEQLQNVLQDIQNGKSSKEALLSYNLQFFASDKISENTSINNIQTDNYKLSDRNWSNTVYKELATDYDNYKNMSQKTGKDLENLFFDSNYVIGIHRCGTAKASDIEQNGLRLTSHLSSGAVDNNIDLSNNISFYNQNELGYLNFIRDIKTANKYKSYGNSEADTLIVAIPKSDIQSFDGENVTLKNKDAIKKINGLNTLDSKYIYGHINTSDTNVNSLIKSFTNENGLLDAKLLPLSNNNEQRAYQQKLINNEKIGLLEKAKFGRDNAKTKIDNYNLKSDHMYRAVDYNALQNYIKDGFIKDNGDGKGYNSVNWYLGGAAPRYGKVIIEAPASIENFELTDNYGGVMSGNPYVRQAHSSNENPLSFSNISNILFLDSTGERILKTVNPNSKNINTDIREGNLLYQIDFLDRKKAGLGNKFNLEDQQLLNNLNNELESIKNTKKYENSKQKIIDLYSEKVKSLESTKNLLSEAQKNNDTLKIDVYKKRINNLEERTNTLKREIELYRPSKTEDINLRNSIKKDYFKSIDEVIPDDVPIVFHGNKSLASVEEIIKSGGLFTPDERGTDFKSFATQIDVTAKKNSRVSFEFADSNNEYLPYGAVFAFMPLESEYQNVLKTGDSSEVDGGVSSVNFKSSDRLVNIITTKENINNLKNICKENNIDPNKVVTHDQFIELCRDKYSNKYDSANSNDYFVNSFMDMYEDIPYNNNLSVEEIQKQVKQMDFPFIEDEMDVNKYFSKWGEKKCKKLDSQTKEAIGNYSGTSYSFINKVLRNTPDNNNAIISRISNAIKSSPLERDAIAYRLMKSSTIRRILNADSLNNIKGLKYHDDAFTSTTVLHFNDNPYPVFQDWKDADVEIAFMLKKGTPALYIESLSHSPYEFELLLDKGINGTIYDVYEEGGKYYINVLVD